jgi:spore germination protein GerM
MKSRQLTRLVFITGTLVSVAIPTFADAESRTQKNPKHVPKETPPVKPRATVTGEPIVLRFADSQCQDLTPVSPKVAFAPPLDFRKIDRLIRTFLKGPSRKTKLATYSKPNPKFESLYAGFRLENETLTLMFSAGAETYLNGTACEQTTHRTPLEQMLLEIQGVKNIHFEVAGKLLGDSDA